MRRAARTDATHARIVQALRSSGWTVVDTSRVGAGFPDLLAIRRGVVRFIEAKDGAKSPSKRKLTQAQMELHAAFQAAGVLVTILTSDEEAWTL
jgi:Holliday junction resolvase